MVSRSDASTPINEVGCRAGVGPVVRGSTALRGTKIYIDDTAALSVNDGAPGPKAKQNVQIWSHCN